MFVKIGDFIKFKGFLLEFSENRRSSENQKHPENRQKSGLFCASPFTMHLVCILLIKAVAYMKVLQCKKTNEHHAILAAIDRAARSR